MTTKNIGKGLLMAMTICWGFQLHAQPKTLIVETNKPMAKIQPTMWGLFFEDINFGADGGLYAELVKNRSFEFASPLMGWQLFGEEFSGQFQVNRSLDENNPHFIRINSPVGKELGIVNEGFRGMGVTSGETYDFSVRIKQESGTPTLKIELLDSTNAVIGSSSLDKFSGQWGKFKTSFVCSKTDSKAKLRVTLSGKGALYLDMVSLFPRHTWKNRPNGLRADMVQKLADLKPGFLRFPGGCIVEGHDLATRYQWKKTVGNVEQRKQIENKKWNSPGGDYYQSFGLGFFEYFQLCEDIGAEPMPILNCGMSCWTSNEFAALDDLDPYVQDAVDLIEFANGAVTTQWGKLRAEMGHPKPFNLKMMGIGNENWATPYFERLEVFMKVLSQKHPEIAIIGCEQFPDRKSFEYPQDPMQKLNVSFIDEHFYKVTDWFLQNATRYDSYDRSGPKIFVGEYAVQDQGGNCLKSALGEAAFMTGLERNADVVHMASYAPLFANINATQWGPDLIWFDNLRLVVTPDYYVQKMFSTNKGTDAVPALMNGKALTGQDSLYASAVIDAQTSELIVKIVNISAKPQSLNMVSQGRTFAGKEAGLTVLTHPDLLAANTLNQPDVVQPTERKVGISKQKLVMNLEAHSFTVVRISLKK